MKKNIILSAALMLFTLIAQAQTTTITFDGAEADYEALRVYDSWEESPFRAAEPIIDYEAVVVDNPYTGIDEALGAAPNPTDKVVKLRRSRYGSNTFGLRIDLKEPIRVTKQLQYIHIMTYLGEKPADSRMMVIGLGNRLEESWNWQTGEDEQFWAVTTTDVKAKAGWQDVVVSFKGFSYAKEENATSGIDIHSLVIVPDVRSPHADTEDWYAYIDEIVVDNSPSKRFIAEKYALSVDKETTLSRNDRYLNKVGLTVGDKTYESSSRGGKKFYTDNTALSVFSAKAGETVQPTFNYTGKSMSGYVYVDWNNDGRFEYTVNDDGTPATGSDIVSYGAAQVGGTWRNSKGETKSGGDALGNAIPNFTIPQGTAPGFYRMRYKVDWNSLDPAGNAAANNLIVNNGGGIVDVMLEVAGNEVTVKAGQRNGDVLLASDDSELNNHTITYGQTLTIKLAPEDGFVQYGFNLKYGYNVDATEQLDDNGNPNYIAVNVPYSVIAGDGTYTIPAEYLRGSHVAIEGIMESVNNYTVNVVGLEEGQGGVVYANIETRDGGTVGATQYFTAEQVQPIAVEGYNATISVDGSDINNRVITVTYERISLPYQQVTSLKELKNYKLYQIKNKNNEGYLAWNTNITDTYLSIRGVTNFGSGQPAENIRTQYAEAVSPFDENTVWQIIKEEDKYYLYQPARMAYVTRSGRDYQFTETKTALDGIRVNGDGTFSFHAGGGYSEDSKNFLCITTNENLVAVHNWTWSDHGSVMHIVENPNVYSLDYAVEITGHADGAIVYDGAEHANGATIVATEFYTAADVEVKALPNSTHEVTFDKENHKITVTYTREELPCQQVTSLSQLKNYKLYQIKNKNNEGYLAWNTNINDTYLSIRGVTNFGSGEPAADIRAQYAEAVSSFDETTVWQIIEEEGKYYLYHPARKAYVTRSGRDYQFTETKTALDAIRVNGDGTFSFHAGGSYSDASTNFACIVTNSTPMAVRNWTWDDHGSVMQIIENPNVYLLDYAVEVIGAEEGGVIFDGTEYADGETLTATEFVQGADFTAAAVDGKISIVNVEGSTIYVSYFDTTTQFYTIKNHKGGYVSLNADYTDANGNLKLTNSTAVADEKGFWAFIGNETDGYKIYNYTTGLHKVLGMTGSEAGARASMVAYDSDTHTTAFYGAIDLDNGEASYIKLSKDGNNYWNKRGDYLALWNSASAYNDKDEGSRFYLTKVEVVGFSEVVAAQWDFTFNRTATSATEDAVTVTVATGDVAVADVSAKILPNREYKAVSNSPGVLCLNKNTGGNDCATAEDPNRYTLVITNSSDINYAFDYIEVSGLAVNGSGNFQPLDVDDRMRNFKVTYGNTSIGPKELYICKKNIIGGGGKVYPHGFGAKMLIPAHGTYTIVVEVYNITRDDQTLGNGCFYGLSKIALGNTTVSFGATGYATLYAPIALTIPEGVTAYTGTLNEDNTWLTLSDIKDGIIPKEHAVILQGTVGAKYTFEEATEGDIEAGEAESNYALKGQTSTIDLDDVNVGDNEAYTLQPNGEGGVVFKRFDGANLTGGKAYLMLPKSSAQSIGIRFEDGTTDIEHSTLNPEPSTQIYDLMGRRVEAITKGGIYIVNGKKVIK